MIADEVRFKSKHESQLIGPDGIKTADLFYFTLFYLNYDHYKVQWMGLYC